ncbi:MAG: isocitrate lyase/PEP mutase family protein [Acetobacteraceae bacterium]|nr:isocitrate lyase/PEP mutase family protein [Acetobacteraceae bacterium]
MNKRQKLRSLLSGGPDIIVAPGAYDGATANLIEAAGFPVVYMTGAGVSAAHGLPDYGLLTMTEMVAQAAMIARSVTIPTIADADTGYGNEINVVRTVQHYEAAGVAALHIEDQVSPKRCGHLAGKEIISRDDFLSKIHAAVTARTDPDLVLIARTDARGVAGMDEALARANAALEVGADMIFLEATTSQEEASAVPKLVNGPCLLNMVLGGKTPVLDTKVAQEMGYRLAIQPVLLLSTFTVRGREALEVLKTTGKHPMVPGGLSIEDLFRGFGSEYWDHLRTDVLGADKIAPAA